MLSVDEIKQGDKVKDADGKVFKVVSVEKDGSLKLTAKGVTSKTRMDAVTKFPPTN